MSTITIREALGGALGFIDPHDATDKDLRAFLTKFAVLPSAVQAEVILRWMAKGKSHYAQSNRQDWQTPPELFAKLDARFDFVVDAAASEKNALCKLYWTKETDGLKQDWTALHGWIFCNPPYGKDTKLWLKKGAEESQIGGSSVLLVNSNTETNYWGEWVWPYAREIWFIKGRVPYIDPDTGRPCNGNTKGQALIIYDGVRSTPEPVVRHYVYLG